MKFYLLRSIVVIAIFSGLSAISVGQNVAQGKPTRQSSQFSPNQGQANLAVDGITDGSFSVGSVTHTADEGTTDPWWEVDLGQVYELNGINVYNRTDCCVERLSGFEILGRTSEGEAWKTIYSGPEIKRKERFPHTKLGRPYFSDPNALPQARFVRIQLTGPGRILSLAEVEVFGSEPGDMAKTDSSMESCTGPNGTLRYSEPLGEGKAILFTQANYRGECTEFTYKDGNYPYSTAMEFNERGYFRFGNNKTFYSMKLGSGIEVTVCTDKFLKGSCKKYVKDAPYLGAQELGSEINSFSIYTLSPKNYVNAALPNDNEVTVCSQRTFGGGCRKLTVGNHDFNGLTYLYIQVGKNVKAQTYSERSFFGPFEVYPAGSKQATTGNVKSIRVMNLTDNIIALKVRPTPNPIPAATPVAAAPVTPAPVTTPASNEAQVVGFSQQPVGGEGYKGPDSSYRLCAKEGEPCKYIGQVSIAYGVSERFSVKEFTVKKEETRMCNEANFGDPAPRLPKRCYVKQIKPVVIEHAAPGPDYTFCVDAPYRCNFSYVGTVAFGVNGFFNYKTGLIRGVDCNVDVFGDPAPGVPQKKCYVRFEKAWVPNNTPTETDNEGPPSADFRVCAAEGQVCRFSGTGTVAFGHNAKGGFLYKNGVKGSIPCDRETFGDISPNKPKACYVRIQ